MTINDNNNQLFNLSFFWFLMLYKETLASAFLFSKNFILSKKNLNYTSKINGYAVFFSFETEILITVLVGNIGLYYICNPPRIRSLQLCYLWLSFPTSSALAPVLYSINCPHSFNFFQILHTWLRRLDFCNKTKLSTAI